MALIRRVDNNQRSIVAALRDIGASVQHLHIIGKGCPDILVGFRGRNYLMEIKMERGKLTPDEDEWHERWRGQVAIVRDADDALRVIGVIE